MYNFCDLAWSIECQTRAMKISQKFPDGRVYREFSILSGTATVEVNPKNEEIVIKGLDTVSYQPISFGIPVSNAVRMQLFPTSSASGVTYEFTVPCTGETLSPSDDYIVILEGILSCLDGCCSDFSFSGSTSAGFVVVC